MFEICGASGDWVAFGSIVGEGEGVGVAVEDGVCEGVGEALVGDWIGDCEGVGVGDVDGDCDRML
jgi:hypothetical protein